MAQILKIIPWVLAAALSVLLAVTWQESQHRAAEIQALKQQNQALIDEAKAKLAAAEDKQKQLADDASAKQRQLAEDAAARLQRLSDEANAKLADAAEKTQQLAADADKRIEQANLPEAQVRVTFRKAVVASGHVAVFSNMSGQPVSITADILKPGTSQSRRMSITLDPGRKKEVGELEGWAFVAGDTVTISQTDHKSVAFTAP
jgi:hypothetical protein